MGAILLYCSQYLVDIILPKFQDLKVYSSNSNKHVKLTDEDISKSNAEIMPDKSVEVFCPFVNQTWMILKFWIAFPISGSQEPRLIVV